MSDSTAPTTLDLRGVPCPVTWARAKTVLESLESGAKIRVLTDDPRSTRDIPGAAEAEGYAVLEIELEGATAAILIER